MSTFPLSNLAGKMAGFHSGFELGGRGRKHSGSRMIVGCERTLTHAYACVPTRRGVWGHASPEKF